MRGPAFRMQARARNAARRALLGGCAALAFCGASALSARAGDTSATASLHLGHIGLRAGPVSYSEGIGSTTAYGTQLGIGVVPALELWASVEYASRDVMYEYYTICIPENPFPCRARPYGFRDLAARANAAAPIFAVPGILKIYVGGGAGEHVLRQPDVAKTLGGAARWETKTLTKPSYHILAGGRVSLPLTHLSAMGEARVSWIRTDPVIRQTAALVGVSLSL